MEDYLRGFFCFNHIFCKPHALGNGKVSRNMDNIIEALLLFIQDNLDNKMTLKELSDIFDMNYCYLSSKFKKRTGMSFPKYKKSLKMEAAKIQLNESTKEIKVIAYNLGYKSLAHFYSDFISFVGVSPKSYKTENSMISQYYLEKIQKFSKESKELVKKPKNRE